jgi:hypothetical protein
MEEDELVTHRNSAAIRAVRRKKVRVVESLLRFLYSHQEPLPVRVSSAIHDVKASFLRCHKEALNMAAACETHQIGWECEVEKGMFHENGALVPRTKNTVTKTNKMKRVLSKKKAPHEPHAALLLLTCASHCAAGKTTQLNSH